MKIIFKIFLIGLSVLVAALAVNLFASAANLLTWYDFTVKIYEFGFTSAVKDLSFSSIIFLVLIYPFILGLVAYKAQKLLNKVLN